MVENVLSREYMVKPSECNAQQKLPLTLLVAQMIDLATDHANLLGIGFLNMDKRGLGWVLSRISVEMERWPDNGEEYVLSTWIESYNHHFSERCFSVASKSGDILGYGRTVWVIIELGSHKSAGTAGTVMPPELIAALDCPIPKFIRQRPFEPSEVTEYVFKYTDIDFYRHVNTVKYIALLLNQFTLEDFDTHILSRCDIAFARESKYGQTAIIKSIKEEVPSPGLMRHSPKSFKRSFEISVDGLAVLNASFVLSEL